MADFNFSNLFGGGEGSLGATFGGGNTGLNALLTDDQRKLMGRNAEMAMAAALLQASAPSTTRIGMGQALGSALQAGQAGYEKAQAGAMNEMLLGQKLKEASNLNKYQEALMGTSAPISAATRALGATGGAAGPTKERAAMMDDLESKPLSRYEELMRKSEIAAQYNDPKNAELYLNMAQKVQPALEVAGQPFEVTGTDGKPLLVQQYKNGTIQTVAGFGPKRDIVLQNMGGQTVAIDKSALTGGQTFNQTMTPDQLASNRIAQGGLNLRQQEFNRGGFDRVDTSEGMFNVPKGGGVATPVMGPSGQLRSATGGQPTEGQSNAAGFSQMMEMAQANIKKLPAGSQPGALSTSLGTVPLLGGVASRTAQSGDQQQYAQAAQTWIRAKLRKESGAAIGADEMAQEYATYFPQVGDSEAKIAQKDEARRVATLGMQKSAGKSYTPYTAPAPATAPSAPAGQMVWDGRKFVFRN